MSEQEFNIGDKVTAIYKTGKYIGEINDIRPTSYLVKVLAVVKHPMQGDLHNPKQTEVSMFHQRRALAFRERTNVPKNMVRVFEEEIPEYKESLREAVENMARTLSEVHTEWNNKSLQLLEELAADYFK
ncbi:kinase-associated lipoprotein B [Peribacillus butanolivorans]|uniref:kinase-associated lipoprotein B n=1 Tax=Peribacillus TaxID=2675229 RepID=UPI0006A6DA8A|nr:MULTISPECIES: kinase-associated lipoprotein B [Peribacillus]KRF67122.1 kinase [Bacillus sp. Soil768D1]KON67131.1 kinase [Peribacillus butanolivorans]MBK5443777.1 kinase-associated lipoprotein B [Peribacillus sp. TH24]MBK5461504.1 kinase-associated lipoprotein B [Peribacillus sp. TH27]MBK5485175.1 kinase-associated lipoprotein B [Peribacillus sp. TH16]